MRVLNLSDVEWLLTESFVVHRIDDALVVPFEDLNVFCFATDLDGHALAVFQTAIGSRLQPSPALYRWVATKGDLFVGSLFASVDDDGLVNVYLRQSAYVAGLNTDSAREIVEWLVSTGARLSRDARDLFS